MDKFSEIKYLESELKVLLPNSYKDFLNKEGTGIVFGLPILGLPAIYEISSALGATSILRLARPDLMNFLSIRVMEDRMLCLDLTKNNPEDTSLVEVNLNSNEPPIKVHESFSQYLFESEQSKAQIETTLKRIKNLYSNKLVKEYSHTNKKGTVPFKARDWRVHRCCVHDNIVGIAAIKYNESFNGIEVDVFLATDHPDYEAGHGVKALITLVLSDAYRNGTSMEVRFTRFDSKLKKRVEDKIPKSLLTIINSINIILSDPSKGIITHDESISIFAQLLEIPKDLRDKIKQLELKNEVTLQSICFLINSKIWSKEQVNWLIYNSERVKAIIYGRDNPENRINYSESLCLGRSACAITKLKEKIENSSNDDYNEVDLRVEGEFFLLTSYKSCSIDWLPNNEIFQINESDTITVLARPRTFWYDIDNQMKEDYDIIKSERGKKVLLYTSDILENGVNIKLTLDENYNQFEQIVLIIRNQIGKLREAYNLEKKVKMELQEYNSNYQASDYNELEINELKEIYNLNNSNINTIEEIIINCQDLMDFFSQEMTVIMILPYSAEELNEEVIHKMKRARTFRA